MKSTTSLQKQMLIDEATVSSSVPFYLRKMWEAASKPEIKTVLKTNLDEENGVFCGVPHFTIYSDGLKQVGIDHQETTPTQHILELNLYIQELLARDKLEDAEILGILLGIEIESIPCQIQLESFAKDYAASKRILSVYERSYLKLFFKIHLHDGGEARHLEEAYRILEVLDTQEEVTKAKKIAEDISTFFKVWRVSYAEQLQLAS